MFRIKLLILLLSSLIFYSCTSAPESKNNLKFNLNYISGGEDGLILSTNLNSRLNMMGANDPDSKFSISASIAHNERFFVTQIDSTSDRKEIITTLTATVFDNNNQCNVYEYKNNISQFFVLSSSIYYLSNQKAILEIKKRNTEILSEKFINKLMYAELYCSDDTKS